MMQMGLFPLVPAVVLLTVSFFVLFAASKTDSKALKSFGRIIAVVLCIFAGFSVVFAIYSGITGKSCKSSWKMPIKSHMGDHYKMRK